MNSATKFATDLNDAARARGYAFIGTKNFGRYAFRNEQTGVWFDVLFSTQTIVNCYSALGNCIWTYTLKPYNTDELLKLISTF